MSRGPIRIGQVIAPFGPGAITIDRRGVPLIICGLDYWYIRGPRGTTPQAFADELDEFKFTDWRFVEELGLDHFRRPPDFRSARKDQPLPPNGLLHIPTFRLPRWYVCTRSVDKSGFRPMRYVGADMRNDREISPPKPPGNGRMVPVRFITICRRGHIDDFPWARWLGCPVQSDGQSPATGHQLFLRDLGGENLQSIKVRCTCGNEETLSGITTTNREKAGFSTTLSERLCKKAGTDDAGLCRGHRPWLGQGWAEPCSENVVGSLLTGSNVYFARTQTSLFIPQAPIEQDGLLAELQRALLGLPKFLKIKLTWEKGERTDAVDLARPPLERAIPELRSADAPEELVKKVIKLATEASPILQESVSQPAAPESGEVRFRRVEFNAFRQPYDNPKDTDLRVKPSTVPELLRNRIARVSLIERLRATRVFLGFDRVEGGTLFGNQAADAAMQQLFRSYPSTKWLPAVDTRGEGIYIEFDNAAVTQWLATQRASLRARLDDEYRQCLNSYEFLAPQLGVAGDEGVDWAATYLLVHGFAHALINQFVFEAGYSSAALRERLYVSTDRDAPMAGVLIYTASGDSEGTLGGLVRIGTEERLLTAIFNALRRIVWCSADPVCSELGRQGPDGSNRAACHACLLLPETSCETINRGLDRAILVGTPSEPGFGFFSPLIETIVEGVARLE